jgi:iron complex outermembrane recepter protein
MTHPITPTLRPSHLLTRTAIVGMLALFPAPLMAQVMAKPEPQSTRNPVHGEVPEDIVVTADYIRELSLLAGQSALGGDELVRDMRPQLGDTLARQAGVSATSFSPGASRPVLRGMQGGRVAVLVDGLGTLDASSTSADHGVSIDPLTAERIEVLRGPAVLLYGNQAIGGAVNVIDRRIPRAMPERGIHFDALSNFGSAADERGGGAALDIALGPVMVLHVDGSYRRSDDLRTGGYVYAPELRADLLTDAAIEAEEGHADEAAELTEAGSLRGRIPNSATETYTAGLGLGIVTERLSFGFSAGLYDTRYGVPARPGMAHAHDGDAEEGAEEAPVAIDMRQIRGDFRGTWTPKGSVIDSVNLRMGYANYTHTEFEGEDVGTVFNSDGWEGRLELKQMARGGWRGVTGGQFVSRDFEAIGAEAFVPANTLNSFGLFTLQEITMDKLSVEASVRYDHAAYNTATLSRDFGTVSGAFGVAYEFVPFLKTGVNFSHSERAPTAEELFSNGPHIATSAFEIGDPNLAKEKSNGVEIYLRGGTGPFHIAAAAYYSGFSNFIYEVPTEQEEDGLPVYEYRQGGARYTGFEVDFGWTLLERGGLKLEAHGVADFVRAELKGDNGDLPRIPPLRLLVGLDAEIGDFRAGAEVEWANAQNNIADFETATDGYTVVNLSLGWKFLGADYESLIILSADNILDVEARRHASFTKDFVPMAGRDIRLGVRVSF